MSDNNGNNLTEHYRKIYNFGFHPTASRAALLLRISTLQFPSCAPPPVAPPPVANDYLLCAFRTEDVLSFCVDMSRVIVANIADECSDFSSRAAPTCLVVDDDAERTVGRAVWSQDSPPKHFIFSSMRYRRALDWIRDWEKKYEMYKEGISIDMHDTYCDESTPFACPVVIVGSVAVYKCFRNGKPFP
eukprot:PhM_4_TR2457/c3_g1_i5/m.64696